MKYKVIVLIGIIFFMVDAKAQVNSYLESGAGYMEHFILGAGLNISDKYEFGFQAGSNFFVNTNDFLNYSILYRNNINKLKYKSLTPQLGLRGGYAIYSNKYYSWELATLVPFLGCSYAWSEHVHIKSHVGLCISRELSVKRIGFGEIGWHKRFLPDFNLTVYYKL